MNELRARIDGTATVAQRRDKGRAARGLAPRSSHAEWAPPAKRRSPVTIISEQNEGRVPWLVPVRHARMSASPFTFYRGAAAVMAQDLAGSPDSDLWVQASGDAHLSNFGAYASPSRELVFDANDFDETLPGPWEWDLKRLAASLVVAAQNLGLPGQAGRKVAAHTVRAYREAMAGYAEMPVMELWYDTLKTSDVLDFSGLPRAELQGRLDRFAAAAQKKTSLQALGKLATKESGSLRIRSQPPLLMPLRELPSEHDGDTLEAKARESYAEYLTTVPDHMQVLLARFDIVDIGLKVVGVGSVGTRCFIILLEGRDEGDPLFLQVKEAGRSVLEPYLKPSAYHHQGQRVVEGQRLVQAQSDVFLGWTTGDRPLYVRQLRDWKGSANVDEGTRKQLKFYAGLCAQTLARGHARSGDAIALSAYMGNSRVLDNAIAEFAVRYAHQNLADFGEFEQALADGLLPVDPPE